MLRQAERNELAALVAPHEAAFAQARKTLADCDTRGAALEEEVHSAAARTAGGEVLRALAALAHLARADVVALKTQTDLDVRDAIVEEQQSVRPFSALL